jgi:hypothetical protein
MSIWRRFISHEMNGNGKKQAKQGNEHAVIVEFDVDGFPQGQDLKEIRKLESGLEVAIESAGAGEYDGDGFDGDSGELFFYGQDADAMLQTLMPILVASSFRPFTVTLQYGSAKNADEKSVRVV